VAFIDSVAVLLPAPRPTRPEEVASSPQWRAVCECPHTSPAQMAIDIGRSALGCASASACDVDWIIHCGAGYQGSAGWPVHHHIQHGILGCHGNAFEIRQHCAGGLTSWMIADPLAAAGNLVICTGADNWSFDDRFVTSRSSGGEPFSDVAHAAVVSRRSGFAKILGTASASRPDQCEPWQTREAYWEHTTRDDFRAAYDRAAAARTSSQTHDSFRMLLAAVQTVLRQSNVSPAYVTHFVPHSSANGEPYRSVAKAVGLPWAESLHRNNLGHGYLGVSTQVAGLMHLAETAGLQRDSIVLLLAAEYQLSATAVLLGIIRPPVVSVDGPTRIAA
jgi:3-oxoacyl-[acyl-carrier-protein] synthase III